MSQTKQPSNITPDEASQLVQFQSNAGVAFITLNRPDKSNAFNADVITQLIDYIAEAESDDNVRVIVLQGNGRHFSAGADLQWMKAMGAADLDVNLQDSKRLAALMYSLYSCQKPTIARVQGSAFGGALGLICCCDIAVGDPQSRFCLSEVRLGLVPAVISPFVNRVIGARAMRRYTLTAELIDADKAQELGILSMVVPLDTLDTEVSRLCEQLKGNAPKALCKAKELLDVVQNNPINDNTLQYVSTVIAKLRLSNEGQEGLSAFLEKRAPQWQVVNKEG